MWGIEIKRSDAPSLTRSMTIVRKDLHLNKLFVVYPGTRLYTLSEDIEVLGLPEMLHRLCG